MDIDEDLSASSQSSLQQVWPDKDFHNAKVLISLALEEDQWLNTDEWVEWLRSVPGLVNHARVDGVYRSGSTLMILSVSVVVWDLLPKNPAMTFIAFVRSENMLQGNCSSPVQIQNHDHEENVRMDSFVEKITPEDFKPRRYGK